MANCYALSLCLQRQKKFDSYPAPKTFSLVTQFSFHIGKEPEPFEDQLALVLHHLYGNPIIPFAPTSSLGCAICDPVIAIWCFAGAPYAYDLFRRRVTSRRQ